MSVGMGVVDVRGDRVETAETIGDRVVSALRHVAAERVALNPDCGFAPDAYEPPTIDEAFEKLKALAAASRMLRERYAT